MMNILDKTFQLIFARFRRKLGDGQIDFAWRRARYRMTIYTSWAVCGVVGMMVIGSYSLFKVGTPSDHKKLLGIVAGITVLIMSILFDVRFKKYLISPPPLSSNME
jgi:hypothetical protein